MTPKQLELLLEIARYINDNLEVSIAFMLLVNDVKLASKEEKEKMEQHD